MAKVLIVDDEPSIRETLGEFVREMRHEAFAAADAKSALEIVARSRPDVVVCDIVLPGMDGLGLLERIRRIAPDAQVIMVTGEPTVETAADAVRQGAFDYLSKPVPRVEIQAAVESALRVKRMDDERRRLAEENVRYREHLEEEIDRKTRALKASETQYRVLVETANEAVFVLQDGEFRYANPKTVDLTGYSRAQLLARPFVEIVHPEDRETVVDLLARQLAGGEIPSETEFRIVGADGETRWIELRPVYVDWGGLPSTLNLATDITERKDREAAVREREERTRRRNEVLIGLATDSLLYEGDLKPAVRLISEKTADVLDVDRVAVWLLDEDAEVLRCTNTYARADGNHEGGRDYPVASLPVYLDALDNARMLNVVDAMNDPRMAEFDRQAMADEGVLSVLDAGVRTGGKLVGDICFESIGPRREWTHEEEEFAAEVASIVALSLESAQRRQAEEALTASEIRYRTLFEGSPISLWQEDYAATKALLADLREEGVEDVEDHLRSHPDVVRECIERIRVVDVNQASVDLHRAGTKENLLGHLATIIPEESHPTFIPQLVAIADGETSFEGLGTDRRFDGTEVDVSIRWIAAPGFGESLSRILVSKVDITAAVEAEAALQAALAGTIEAIGLTTEMRDPYTAGHQRRVTALAVTIAEELGLVDEAVDAIRAAGLMHDIGKMAVPAEILSKPSGLSELEMSLIRAHPRVAYDILKRVTFPWPVAEIVLQHHERLDGSGYPEGLAGNAIRREAQILCVADTVEAMASHRPYRAALGIDAALAEIETHRGTRYAADAVDACVRLFREGAFRFRDEADESA